MNKKVGAFIGGAGGLVAAAWFDYLLRKTAYDINALVIAKTGTTEYDVKVAAALHQQYAWEASQGGLHGFLAWKLLDYGRTGGLAYGEMAPADVRVIIYAALVAALIGALAASKRGWALLPIIGLAAWGAIGGGGSIYVLGNVLGRAIMLIGGAIGGTVALVILELWRSRQGEPVA